MKKSIVISGVNLSEGGPLTVIKSVLTYLDSSDYNEKFRIIALVHSKELFSNLKNIELKEYPEVKLSWKNRVYFEYIQCKEISNDLNPYLWLSLHDITPNVNAVRRAVYCHNASPFYNQSIKDFIKKPIRFLYTKFYKQFYRINIHKNNYVIVQQKWIKDAFINFFNLKNEKVIVSLPDQKGEYLIDLKNDRGNEFIFFYPAFPREFKNFEVICKAVEILKSKGNYNFKVQLTIDGTENKYAKEIVTRFFKNKEIEFIGLLSKEKVEEHYQKANCLIFPSKLETWGLPISEFKHYKKMMLIADLPYAYETVGDYQWVRYFNVLDDSNLANDMYSAMNGTIEFTNKGGIVYDSPICRDWDELFKILMK